MGAGKPNDRILSVVEREHRQGDDFGVDLLELLEHLLCRFLNDPAQCPFLTTERLEIYGVGLVGASRNSLRSLHHPGNESEEKRSVRPVALGSEAHHPGQGVRLVCLWILGQDTPEAAGGGEMVTPAPITETCC